VIATLGFKTKEEKWETYQFPCDVQESSKEEDLLECLLTAVQLLRIGQEELLFPHYEHCAHRQLVAHLGTGVPQHQWLALQ
jgi:hypothetical protein